MFGGLLLACYLSLAGPALDPWHTLEVPQLLFLDIPVSTATIV